MSRALSPDHLHMLREGSGISDEVIEARGYFTATDRAQLRELGFAPRQCQVPALVLPVCPPDRSNGLYVLRPDLPRVEDQKDRRRNPDGTYPQKVLKYEMPAGGKMRLDVPPTCLAEIGDPSKELWITEGQKKADALASRGLCAVGLLGVWNFRGRNDLGGKVALSDLDYIALNDGRPVRIVFDSDVMRKPEVGQALKRLTEILQQRGAAVAHVYLPAGEDGSKIGVDDWLVAGHSAEDLQRLVEAPRPAIEAAPAQVRLLDGAPKAITRPLALVDGRAYAATWLWAEITRSEKLTSRGEVVKLTTPEVTVELRDYIVRDDGAVFGDGASPPASLGVRLHLPEQPPTDRLWSVAGVKRYAAGERPDPAGVFGRVADVVDRFIDFNRSLADQRTMAEMVACYILSTYLLDAMNVVGFLWPNGDRGSGKTHLLHVVCELAYLGQVILAGGSYASLRDLADYGACLAFDDAENLSDPKRTDPDKRALLLAGNRRGSTVPVKEPDGNRAWRTRYVNTFCPRLFSAIRLPDAVLASRSIVVPLIRTPDRYRANADPLDHQLWPHDRQDLVDELWALALAHLPAVAAVEREVNRIAALAGRNLEPWKGILTVAYWLEQHDVEGLFDRMQKLSLDYQRERPDLEVGDLTLIAVRALVRMAADGEESLIVKTADVVATAKKMIEELEIDFDGEGVTSRRMGRVLAKMRLEPDRALKSARRWRMSRAELEGWASAYGVVDGIDDTMTLAQPDVFEEIEL